MSFDFVISDRINFSGKRFYFFPFMRVINFKLFDQKIPKQKNDFFRKLF